MIRSLFVIFLHAVISTKYIAELEVGFIRDVSDSMTSAAGKHAALARAFVQTLVDNLSETLAYSLFDRPHTPFLHHRDLRNATLSKQTEGRSTVVHIYESTVILPQTSFGMKANAVIKEPEIQTWWLEKGVYTRLATSNPGPAFVLHDGPPYANGDLHIGHALNKILKDFINRYKALCGFRVRFIPGWDTHGLPIELKVLQSLPAKDRRNLSTMDLRKKARRFAEKTVNSQSEQFRRYGVWGEFDNPYLTLQPGYEAAQIEVFGNMFLKGYIYRGLKPVHWSPSSMTALADAELEYPDNHVSRSIYVAMRAVDIPESAPIALREVADDVAFAIWTTTPWTIPANLAIAINPKLEYALVKAASFSEASEHDGKEIKKKPLPWPCRHLVVAKGLVDDVAAKLSRQLHVVATFSGSKIEGCGYQHPLLGRVSHVVAGGDYITTESGTGLVHTAPGHGAEDYLVGQKYGLELLSPVDDVGNFTAEAGERFAGKNVQGDGNDEVISALNDCNALLAEMPFHHKYPYDWRTKKPTIVRATRQWFASVDGFRAASIDAIRNVTWIPSLGGKRILNMVSARQDWCISRQRRWGVPIPVFYDKRTEEPLMNRKTLAHVQNIFAERGSDAWFYMKTEDLLPQEYRADAEYYERGTDTMDVWFDSGSSWASVMKQRGMDVPVDLYLEGADQSRGWFQSSLLTSVAATGIAPYKSVLTHGFVLDEKGNKMSKSLGNVVDPRMVIEGGKNKKKDPPYGADVLRFWVASVDYTGDVRIGSLIMKAMFDRYLKLRITIRFLLGNLAGFDPSAHTVTYAALPQIDRWMLARTGRFLAAAQRSYDTYTFQSFTQELSNFCVNDLSSFYFDVIKDRMYNEPADSFKRRSCQTTLYHVLMVLLKTIAPITPHIAEDVWRCLSDAYKDGKVSIFESGWHEGHKEWLEKFSPDDMDEWDMLFKVRGAVRKLLNRLIDAKLIGTPLEAQVYLHTGDVRLHHLLETKNSQQGQADEVDTLRKLFTTSKVHVLSDKNGIHCKAGGNFTEEFRFEGNTSIFVEVCGANGKKCERCSIFSESLGTSDKHPGLCERCLPLVVGMGLEARPAEPVKRNV